jgi:hypothetical protein
LLNLYRSEGAFRSKHSGFAGDAEQANNHNNGWTMVLGWLQSYAEKGETVESRG